MLDAKLLPTYLRDTLTLYGTWIPRRGDDLILTVEVATNYHTLFTATVFHKNYNETGDGATTGESATFMSTTGRQVIEALGVKELVRLQLQLEPDEDAVALGEIGKVLYRVLQPVWFEALKV